MTTVKVNSDPTRSEDMPHVNDIASCPRDVYVLLFGPSGYTTTPLRCEVGRHDPSYASHPWRNHSNDSFTDGGEAPVGWLPLPRLRESTRVLLSPRREVWKDDKGWWFAHDSARYGPFETERLALRSRDALRSDTPPVQR